jgi:hypothetical protein
VARTPKGRFQAFVCEKSRQVYVGTFDSVEEAARERDKAAAERYGEFAVLNYGP